MFDWIADNQALVWWLGAVSVATFVGTLVAIPILVVRMPADYFLTDGRKRRERWAPRHPAVHVSLVVLKNLLGVVLLAAGVAMLVLPGQGVLCILLGVTLIDFPGKGRVELWFVKRRAVRKAINWMRRKRGKGPLELPGGVEHAE